MLKTNESQGRAPKRAIRVVLIVVAIAMGAMAISPRARLLLVWAVGRNSGCALQASLNSHDQLLRFAAQQTRLDALSHVIVKEPSGFELVDTPRGQYWNSRHEPLMGFLLAEQEAEIYGDATHGVQPGDIVLDCGADIGVFTRTALNRGARLVVAVEPAPASIASLQRTFEREIAEGRVIVYPKGVWDKVDTLDLEVSDGGTMSGSSLVTHDERRPSKIKVPLTTIDLMVEELKLPAVTFIKMDIEGAEKWALRGAAQTIKKFRPRMALSTEHLPDDSYAIPRTVKAIYPDYDFEPTAGSCRDQFLSINSNVLMFQTRNTSGDRTAQAR
jgi:FkbM family methyltransferase